MDLVVKIEQDFDGTISVTDLALETSNGYASESVTSVTSNPNNFKYSQTCTLDIVRYSETTQEKLIDALYTNHISAGADSVRFSLPYDGHFTVDHIVLPTMDWLKAIYDEYAEDLTTALFDWEDTDGNTQSGWFTTNYANGIYVVDVKTEDDFGNTLTTPIYTLYEVTLVQTDSGNIDLENSIFKTLIIDNDTSFDDLISGVSELTGTTISLSTYNVFSIAKLKDCYVKASTNILNQVPKCGKINESDRFNRDFLWMTINVINIWLEKDEYDMAQVILERLGCYNFCPDILGKSIRKDCGCSKLK